MNNLTELKTIKLSDKFELDEGRIFITGTQAIVRLLLIQKSLDARAGLNTAGFVSGYRGSPMGTVDYAMWREKARLDAANIVFQPGINEDLAATAIWGTQQLDSFQNPLVDGVYSIWYGKAPGVDRSGDVLRHGNSNGTHKNGGVLVFYGDDHPGKSSTIVCQSEPALAAMHIPSLYPSNVQEIIDFGILGWALSRYSGLWVGVKCVNETVEQTQTVDIDIEKISIITPDRGASDSVVNIQPGFVPPAQAEVILKRHRLPLVHKFVRANNIDKVKIDGKGGIGIVTAGKTYEDVIQAMNLIGLSHQKAESLGIGVYKIGCVWPLEPTGLKEFAGGRPELLFIEEKNPIVEDQASKVFINEKQHPVIAGKHDPEGNLLFVSDEQLSPVTIAQSIAARLDAHGQLDNETREMRDKLMNGSAMTGMGLQAAGKTPAQARMPYFCSGCPHNTSTKVPVGSIAMAGIGCHTMAIFNRRDTLPPTHMGGEGMNWAGASPFSGTKHMFQNLGDGTYFHSGLIAIRGAVASGTNITYKILFNDAVAMTGGQPIDGPISVASMARQVLAEGVTKCVIVSDQPENYRGNRDIPKSTDIHHRDDLEHVQTQMREIEGTSVLIYEQTCAAEKRRRRKRGTYPNPAKRMFINAAVCEGCGDCSVQSTCVSIQPLETSFGTKRVIDQSSCNKDYSCVRGFCPSFVTVLGSEPKKPAGVDLHGDLFKDLPEPVSAEIKNHNMGIMIAGIGGTGVITVGAILGIAAHMEGKACSIYDMTGLSQKNGAVYSHLRIADEPEDIATQRIGAGEAELVMAFDLLAALSGDAAITYNRQTTRVIGNAEVAPTSGFQFDRDMKINAQQVERRLEALTADGHCQFLDASMLALKLCGDTIASNMLMVGFALQQGLLPVSLQAVEKAIELNGVAISFNLAALSLGRLYAHSPQTVQKLLPASEENRQETLDELITSRVDHLTQYQNAAWANRYSALVKKISEAETSLGTGSSELTRRVATNLSKLMSYKDEYEVARLHSDPAFHKKLDEQFEPGYTLKYNLAPPLFSKRDKVTGQLLKSEYGSWVGHAFKLLAKMKGLRGGTFDIFGKTAERKMERRLISEYEDMISSAATTLNAENHSIYVELAALPQEIRGYGHIKEESVQQAELLKSELISSLSA